MTFNVLFVSLLPYPITEHSHKLQQSNVDIVIQNLQVSKFLSLLAIDFIYLFFS